MPKRKYTIHGETPAAYECTNKKCKWQGLDSEKVKKPIKGWGAGATQNVCPNCLKPEFYGLLDLPTTNN